MAPSQTLRHALAAAVATLAGMAGCGGQDPAPAPQSAAQRAAPIVVSLKRWAGSDPAEDDILVRRDRTAELHLIHGGAGGHFRTVRMSPAEWGGCAERWPATRSRIPGRPRAGR